MIINGYNPYLISKSERIKIQRTFEKLEKGGIVKSTTLKKDYKIYQHDSYEEYEVTVGNKVFKNERKVEKKEKRKPNTNKFILAKSIKLDDTKKYSEKIIDSISYSLDLLLSLIKLKSNINLSIQTNSSKIDLSSVKIKSIIFDTNYFTIKFNNTTITLTDINQIKLIQSYDNSGLSEDIEKLNEYPTEVTEPISKLIKDLEIKEEMFVF